MKRKIIIIEDDRELCEEMHEILTDEGYSVMVAFNGLDGLNLIESHACDLLLLDLKMPGLGGEDLLARLAGQDQRPKVLVLTAKIFDGHLGEPRPADRMGWELVKDVIGKPFDIPLLLRKVRDLLG